MSVPSSHSPDPASAVGSDPEGTELFAEALDLENAFYAEGYALGAADGERAGRQEGRAFGLEKGFEKAVAMGRLRGRAEIWRSRAANAPPHPPAQTLAQTGDAAAAAAATASPAETLALGERARRQLARLCELTDPATLVLDNTEEGVDAFDDRLRDARAKATLIAKLAGEDDSNASEAGVGGAAGPKVASGRAATARGLRVKDSSVGAAAEMEDFVGLPGVRRKE